DTDFDLGTAYAVQRAYVQSRLKSNTIAGFKVGAIAEAAHQMFGLSGPFTGVLLTSGAVENDSTIERADFRTLLLETELGFRVGRTIDSQIDLATLKSCISECLPVVELPDAGLYGSAKAIGVDLIAANGASAGYLTGETPEEVLDVNEINVAFSHDGETLHQGRAGDVLGDQWQALLWLVNEVVAQGYTVDEGHLLITGAIGAPHAGQPGEYVADYGDFGRLTFTVV
ncbi:MAG: fumarylacetoacetate hydrolase family protein, partial [Pseudomonadales bacterium]